MNPLHRIAVWVGPRSWLPRLSPLVVAADRSLQRISRGRLTLLAVCGLPELMLHVVGRRSGVVREVRLLGVPWADGWLVAGSNWGLPREPAWVGNLLAAGTATVRRRGTDYPVTPMLLSGPDRDRAWQRLLDVWPAYAAYAERTSRTIKVFHLVLR